MRVLRRRSLKGEKMNEVPTENTGASKRIRKILWGIVVTIICIPFILVLNFVYLVFTEPSRIVHVADAGFKKAEKTIDPEQLRAWALKEIPKYPFPTNTIFAPKILNSEIPDYVQALYSQPVENACVFNENGVTNVTISWGGPFFHWMLAIGPTNFVYPKDPEVTAVEWVPGVYYVREDTRHPFQ